MITMMIEMMGTNDDDDYVDDDYGDDKNHDNDRKR